MKNHLYKSALVVAILCCSLWSYAQTIPYVNITNWQGNKQAAVCVTLDDGCVNQFMLGQPILDSLGIKGTFNIITNLASNCDGAVSSSYANIYAGKGSPQYWNMLQNAINVGHEIGAHTVHHYYLGNIWDSISSKTTHKEWRDTVGQEIKYSKDTLEHNLYETNGDPYNVLTFAYPYGSGQDNDSIVDSVQKYFIAARAAGTFDSVVTWDTYADADTNDTGFFNYYYQVESYAATDTMTTKWFTRQLDSTAKYLGWFIPMYHNIGSGSNVVSLDSDEYTVTTDAFRSQMKALMARQDSFWIAPFRDVVRYSKEKISTTIYASSNPKLTNDSIITIYMSDTIKDSIFNIPLTVQVWGFGCTCGIDSVKQAGRHLKFKKNNDTLQFNAVPDSGNITIYRGQAITSVIPSVEDYFELYQNTPNPASATTTIAYNLKQAGNVQLELFDISGTTAKTLVNELQTPGKYSYILNTDPLQPGVYFYRLSSGNVFDVKKMVIIK